ncbi:hypothetical protein K503DRAFT_864372 [Rhizopogon vinicolor AM-OR11-026]|uniref:CLASP N-terminal domain-containing protein n=1 Tax=Rhizopogon vinicolor AM-OR11-026 TaxID=1314800 RepID=A0A1B7N7B7_9AGAM|nr:hypothetical protein K503DRAFT_864372 [Rhizopogon vinicolor AM-OR11-026]
MVNRVCCSAYALNAEFEVARRKVQIGASWNTVEEAIVDLIEFSNYGGCKYPITMVAGILSLSKSLIDALNSEHSSLSSSTIELITSLSEGLGPAFEPLISIFMPNLLGLCAQTNKVFASRAKACIVSVIKHTQSPSILPYVAESLRSGSLCFLSDSVESFIAPLTTLEKRVEVQGTASSRSAFRPTTGRARPVGSIILQGALRVPSQSGPSYVQSTTQRRDVARPAVPTTQCPQRAGNDGTAAPRVTSHAHSHSSRPTTGRVPSEPGSSSTQSTNRRRDIAHPTQLPRWVGKMLMRPDPLLVPDGVEMPRTTHRKTHIHILSAKISSVGSLPKPLISQSDPKNNPVVRSVNPSSATTSRTRPLPSAKAAHPAMRVTSSRIPRPRVPTTKLQMAPLQIPYGRVAASRSSKQVVDKKTLVRGGRPVTKDTKPVVKALPRRSKPCGMKKSRTWKPTPGSILPPSLLATVRPTTAPLFSSSLCISRRSRHFEPAALQELPVPAIGHDLRATPEETYRMCRLRRAACLPSRDSCSNFPSTSILASTPRRSILSPLSPFQAYGAEIIAHTHTPNSHISCLHGCEMRHALERFDIRTPVKSFVASTPCAPPSSRLSLLHVCGAETIAHTHIDPDDYTTHSSVSCFRGCDLREVLERSFIELDHATMLYC